VAVHREAQRGLGPATGQAGLVDDPRAASLLGVAELPGVRHGNEHHALVPDPGGRLDHLGDHRRVLPLRTVLRQADRHGEDGRVAPGEVGKGRPVRARRPAVPDLFEPGGIGEDDLEVGVERRVAQVELRAEAARGGGIETRRQAGTEDGARPDLEDEHLERTEPHLEGSADAREHPFAVREP
jgi:hypothetical protein